MSRLFPRQAGASRALAAPFDAPRLVRRTVIDFAALTLPADVRGALAEAFWSYFGARATSQLVLQWGYVRLFARFARETGALQSLANVRRDLLVRYIEWLNAQRRTNGKPWTVASRAGPYTCLRRLLQWLQRCRPGLLGELEFPFNPFPWRNRDSQRVERLPAPQLRAILKACERDITHLRALRARGEAERSASAAAPAPRSLGALLAAIDERYAGIVPAHKHLATSGHHDIRAALIQHGGSKQVEPYLYPRAESLLPYYLALLIHTAGNPQPIAEISRDCLQPIPLLEERQVLLWEKRRAGGTQRRPFSSTAPFAPPVLVGELIEWTRRLRAHAPKGARDRLLLFKGARGINAWSAATAKTLIRTDFCPRHALPHFSLACLRPSVLSAFYRASGDLLQVKAIANHRQLSTTVHYVQAPHVQAQHRARIAVLQRAFLGRISQEPPASSLQPALRAVRRRPRRSAPPPGRAVSMFGFDCKDPLSGIAPGTHRGQLCSNFLGCFTCPNAVITADAPSLARLLQAREHLRRSAMRIHPARFQAIYAPLLRILEEDVLTRFAAYELTAAAHLLPTLPPLPELR